MFDSESVARITEHMNEDHADALMLYLRAFANVDGDSVKNVLMTNIDSTAIEIVYAQDDSESTVQIGFAETIGNTLGNPSEARGALVEMVRLASQRLEKR